jgi:hypothetical protein
MRGKYLHSVASTASMVALTAACSAPTATTNGGNTASQAVPTATLVAAPAAAEPKATAVVAEAPTGTAPTTADASKMNGINGIAAGVQATKWSSNVKITVSADKVRYESNGYPSHELPDQYVVPKNGNQPPFSSDGQDTFEIKNTKDWIKETPIDLSVPSKPEYSDKTTQTSLGMIGVMVSGAALYNDYENPQRSVVAKDDQVVIGNATFLDTCSGHALQSGSSYHYHGVPYCITDKVDIEGKHSTMIGFLRDGFPVYGNKNEGGTKVINADLDACSGHFGPTPEFPDGIYHYHLTDDKAPYSIDCYHGKVDASATQGAGGPGGAGGGPPGGPPDLVAAATKLGITEDALRTALGTSRPPNFEDAAKKLGITAQVLRAALGAPAGPPP